MNVPRNRIVIAGTSSGAGKTTVTVGIMAALHRRGLTVQGFKCGPDYIDPSYHTAVTGRRSRNVDTWMLSHDTMREIFLRGSDGADICVVEGVMGLYDGKDPLSDVGSTAEISILLDAPVILVVNVRSMARSAAATVMGYQKLNERVQIAGVIVNQCGSASHYRIVKSAIEQECNVPVLGWLERDEELHIPERHLGLIPAVERGELHVLFERIADRIEQGINLDALLRIAQEAPSLRWPNERLFQQVHSVTDGPVIAVARDAAFNFYYEENLEMLEQLGAQLVYFSPLAGENVPVQAEGVYIGGGFPEEFAAELAANEFVKADVKQRVTDGLPIYAECGGYMYLANTITDRSGCTHNMVGLIPANVTVHNKLAALGYREAKALQDCLLLEEGDTARGHEFHYSVMEPIETATFPFIYESTGLRGVRLDGYSSESIMAGYIHIHFASNPKAAQRFLSMCLAYRNKAYSISE
jgi:cobyrinic acid a,c-diamide synthase